MILQMFSDTLNYSECRDHGDKEFVTLFICTLFWKYGPSYFFTFVFISRGGQGRCK